MGKRSADIQAEAERIAKRPVERLKWCSQIASFQRFVRVKTRAWDDDRNQTITRERNKPFSPATVRLAALIAEKTNIKDGSFRWSTVKIGKRLKLERASIDRGFRELTEAGFLLSSKSGSRAVTWRFPVFPAGSNVSNDEALEDEPNASNDEALEVSNASNDEALFQSANASNDEASNASNDDAQYRVSVHGRASSQTTPPSQLSSESQSKIECNGHTDTCSENISNEEDQAAATARGSADADDHGFDGKWETDSKTGRRKLYTESEMMEEVFGE
ncbi:MAG: hypothetical protein AAFQ28_04925 [Pseudomonadota bacterium]